LTPPNYFDPGHFCYRRSTSDPPTGKKLTHQGKNRQQKEQRFLRAEKGVAPGQRGGSNLAGAWVSFLPALAAILVVY